MRRKLLCSLERKEVYELLASVSHSFEGTGPTSEVSGEGECAKEKKGGVESQIGSGKNWVS